MCDRRDFGQDVAMEAREQNRMGGLPYSQRLKTVTLDTGNPDRMRRSLKEYFNQTYSLYEDLFTHLADEEAYFIKGDPLRHPMIFYYGHTACFFINKMVTTKLWTERVDAKIEAVCAVGVDELSWDDLDDKKYSWPTVDEVRQYRNKVREVVNKVIDNIPLRIPVSWEEQAWIIMMGIEHERVHLETSSVLIRQLPLELLQPQPSWPICQESSTAPPNQLLPVKGGNVELGRESKEYYGWDNEFGASEHQVSPFSASQYLVRNKEYMGFVGDRGYETKEWWTEEGWRWVKYQHSNMPRFWREDGMKLRCMAQVIDMPLDWPAEVNYLEAKAFCNWLAQKTKQPIRLPTEAEWLQMRMSEYPEIQYPNWEEAPGNIDLAFWASSCPVTKFKHGRFYDLIGNVWQWCESPINGFPGFKPHPAYEDFSTPTFDGKHNLIKGGSWITTGNEALDTSRYAYRRHFYQHAGFRYILSNDEPKLDVSYYETDALLAQYLDFHFGKPHLNSENYPTAIVKYALEALGDTHQRHRAMDLGCAVGRASFELARSFDEVVGVDFSARFIRSAVNLQQNGKIRWQLVDEGEICSFNEITLQELKLDQETVDRARFLQGDACNLKDNLTNFDVVIAANLIDRLYDPMKFLTSIQDRITAGGILAISSPYTWMEEHTEKSKWLGGYKKNAENLTTLRGLENALSAQFEMVGKPKDVEFVIRETRRKFQHTFAQLTLWRKKEGGN